jgi:tungstate transport system ATP-binding protein
MTRDEIILEAKNLKVMRGGRLTLDVPALKVAREETVAVVGPNGSGKSTLLLTLALLLRAHEGAVIYHGKAIENESQALAIRRRTAVVFQEPLLLAGTVRDNVALGLRLRGVKSVDALPRVRQWLDRFAVSHLADRQARTLSGGEARRVSLARAFVLEPEIIFLDEPFNALDTPTHQALVSDLAGVLHETGTSTLMVTHDRNEALALASRVAVIISGQLRQLGKPDEIFGSPADVEVAAFVGAENILKGRVFGQQEGVASLRVDNTRLEAVSDLEEGTSAMAVIRPENITLSLPQTGKPVSSALNQLAGKVTALHPLGAQVRVSIDCGFPLVAIITLRSNQELGITPGKDVVASFKASEVHLIRRGQATHIKAN